MYDMAQLQYYCKSNTLKYKKLLDIIFEKEDVKTTKIISNNFLDTELLKVYKHNYKPRLSKVRRNCGKLKGVITDKI